MKTMLVALLVLAVLLVGLPIMTGMDGMGWCPACLTGHASDALGLCLGVLAAGLVTLALSAAGRSFTSAPMFRRALFATAILRPPRSA
ncbi:MAG: hypothetical protein ACR2M4_09115 [Actinomycetota bacterium]